MVLLVSDSVSDSASDYVGVVLNDDEWSRMLLGGSGGLWVDLE